MTGIDGVFGPETDEGKRAESEAYERAATSAVRELFDGRRQAVFFSRQVEILHERRWFHWITKRALKTLEADGTIRGESRLLAHGGRVNLFWHRSHRYYRRDATRVVDLINEYADPNIGAALGLQGELLVLEGLGVYRKLVRAV